MTIINRIALDQGLGAGDLWQRLRQVLEGRHVEIWSDVFEPGIFWLAEDARSVLMEAGVPFTIQAQIRSDLVPVYHPRHLQPVPETLPNDDSVTARVLAGHGIGAVLCFIGDGQQMPPEEPRGPTDTLFCLSKPGAGYYVLWRLFHSKDDAEQYVAEQCADDDVAKRWAASIPVMTYGELVQKGAGEH